MLKWIIVGLVAVGFGLGFGGTVSQWEAEVRVQNGIKRAMVTTDARTMMGRIEFVFEDLDFFGVPESDRTRYDLESIHNQLRDLQYGSAPSSAEYQASVANARGALAGILLDGTARERPFSVNMMRILMLVLWAVAGLLWLVMESLNKELGGRASHHHHSTFSARGR